MRFVWCVVLGWLSAGCMVSGRGSTMSGSALVHPNFPYGVSYDDTVNKSVLGDDWKLETYRRKPQDSIKEPADLLRKADYDAEYEFDFNDDDDGDAKATLPMPDLLFVNKRTNAKIEVTTLLLDVTHEKKELRLLLNDVVEAGTGTRSLFVGFGRAARGVEKRYASRLLDSEEANLGGQSGLVATIETTDLDQVQINPKARARMTRLFLMRAPFDYYVPERRSGGQPPQYHRYRVLLAVEYSNGPEDFEAQYPEFSRLMGKLHLMGDLRMLAYLRELLVPCNEGKPSNAGLTLEISPVGRPTVRAASSLDTICATEVVSAYPFAATGEGRIINGTYDFSKTAARPPWLDTAEYQETRAPSAAAPPAPPGEPSPTAPATTPAAAATPTAPATAANPAGASAPTGAAGPSPLPPPAAPAAPVTPAPDKTP
ncbi:MAG TPA: hypothetical protein VHB79_34195 [Polyangiaceae bacterium]|nr:hypothetical protein [Polyangiaceae bacterium]